MGEELGRFALAGLEVGPFAVLGFLAYAGVLRTWCRVAAILWLLFLTGLLALMTIGTAAMGADEDGRLVTGLAAAAGAFVAVCAGASVWIPPVRRFASHHLALDPQSFVHAVALSAAVTFTIFAFVPLVCVGRPPMLSETFQAELTKDDAATMRVSDDVYRILWVIPAAFLCVGWPVVRAFRAAVDRLGLARISLRSAGAAVGLALFFFVAMHAVEAAATWFWELQGWRTTDMGAFEKIIAYSGTWAGAVSLAVAAGVGEELLVRGVLQPRLGIILSNLLFTGMHALQYDWDALIQVFAIGCLLGLMRRRTSTTFTAIVHAAYDFALCAAAILTG